MRPEFAKTLLVVKGGQLLNGTFFASAIVLTQEASLQIERFRDFALLTNADNKISNYGGNMFAFI